LLLIYIQGNFLVSGLPPLDGTAVDWNAQPLQRYLSIGIGAALLAVTLFAALRFYKLFRKIVLWGSAGLTAMLAITLGTLLMTTPVIHKESLLKPTGYNAFEYSTDTNLIVLVIDAVDGNELAKTMDNNPEFKETFRDFTYFNNALAGYPFTRNSLPLMLTGQWFENKTDFNTYVGDAFQSSPLMTKLTDEDYRIGLYNDGELNFDAETYHGVFENQVSLQPHFYSTAASFKLIYKMSAIRYAPWDLKFFGYDVVDYANGIKVLPTYEYGDVLKKNSDFYAAIHEKNPITTTPEKCARILHIEGGHVPFQYDKNVNIIENGTYQDNLEATLTICQQYINRLKESGVYDNSAVVILADHGFNATATGLPRRMHPALMIKGIGEHSDTMRVSDVAVSYEQLARAFAAMLDKTPTASLFPAEAYPGGRRFIAYWYLEEDKMEEYLATGKADEIEKMNPTGKKYDAAS
ncbi:MAG: sulfatase-like hydrolase/transferase, partial [Clostridia bacterium]|nr:sulfatase-like hydrolase/transferase [Clostridia bacterium]